MVENPDQSDATPRVSMKSWPYKDLREAGDPHHWAGTDISDEQLRALCLGAILSVTWDAYHDTLVLNGPDGDPRERVIGALHEWWGITSGEEAIEMVNRLHAGMHAPAFAVVHPLVMDSVERGGRHNVPEELATRHVNFLQVLARSRHLPDDAYSSDYQLWLQAIRLGLTKHAPKPLATNIVGWDLCRAAFLLRAGATAGYLTEDQAWDYLHRGLGIARRYFRNWRQLGDSYLTGHAYWSSRDLSDVELQTKMRRAVVMRLWQLPESPWRRVALHQGGIVY